MDSVSNGTFIFVLDRSLLNPSKRILVSLRCGRSAVVVRHQKSASGLEAVYLRNDDVLQNATLILWLCLKLSKFSTSSHSSFPVDFAMTTFYFLDGRDADPESKRLMRRHVMKGKNAGKRIHRGSRLALQKARAVAAKYPDNPLQPVVHYSYQQRVRDMNWIYLSLGSAARSFGNVLQPFSLPFEVTVETLSVINRCRS